MLLIDECLSDALVRHARQRGHLDATHVRWLGMRGWQDHNLMPRIVEGGYTFVTQNSYDFRGPRNAPGTDGHHARVEIHGGLICLNAPQGVMTRAVSIELFDAALDEYETDADLDNMAIEVTLPAASADHLVFDRYPIPRTGPYARHTAPKRSVRPRPAR